MALPLRGQDMERNTLLLRRFKAEHPAELAELSAGEGIRMETGAIYTVRDYVIPHLGSIMRTPGFFPGLWHDTTLCPLH